MEKEFKPVKLVKMNVVVTEDHAEYLRDMDNYSKFLRWRLDNDEGYIKRMKEENE